MRDDEPTPCGWLWELAAGMAGAEGASVRAILRDGSVAAGPSAAAAAWGGEGSTPRLSPFPGRPIFLGLASRQAAPAEQAKPEQAEPEQAKQ